MQRFNVLFMSAIVLAGATTVCAQDWSGPAAVSIQATSRKGSPITGAQVSAKLQSAMQEGGPQPVMTDAKGRVVIANLAQGTWQIEVSHPDYLAFVAVVDLVVGKKPNLTASFLQAGGTSLTPMKVKVLRASSFEGPAPPMVAEKPKPKPKRKKPRYVEPATPDPAEEPEVRWDEPVEPAAAEPSQPPPAVEPVEEEPSARQPAPPPAPPTREPAPPIQEPAPPQPPQPEPEVRGTVAPPPVVPEPAPTEIEPEPTPVPVTPPQPQPTAEPKAPAPEPEPEVVLAPQTEPQPTEAPVTPPPVAPQPAPDVPEPKAEEVPPPPAAEPQATQVPVTPPPVEPLPPPVVPEPEPEEVPSPPMTEPEPTVVPDVLRQAEAEPEPTETLPPQVPEAPPSERIVITPEPEEIPSLPVSEPEPEEIPSPPVPRGPVMPAPAPTMPSLSSFRDSSCVECKTGEWAVTSTTVAGAAPAGALAACPAGLLEAIQRVADRLANASDLEETSFAGPAFDGSTRDAASAAGATVAGEVEGFLAPWFGQAHSCQAMAVVLPRFGRFVGFQYDVADQMGSGACLPQQDCEVGEGRWQGSPQVVRGTSAQVIYGIFQNLSQDRDRRAQLTVYFRPPTAFWRPPQ